MFVLLSLACTRAPILPPHRVFPSSEAALAEVLASQPRVLGVGEIHASTDRPGLASTLSRFTERFMPVLAPRTTDLVIETWRLDRACGAPAEAIVEQVEEDTKRPEATKDELTLLIERAVALGVKPHDLILTCEEYATLTDEDGEVSYDRLLVMLTEKLSDYAQRGLQMEGASLVLYGGAMHNDLYPDPTLSDYSYGPRARATGGEAYVELDLYDAALLRGREGLIEAAWAPLLDATGPDKALLFERGPQSFVLFMEEQAAPASLSN